jgi:hypothetical protein
MCAKFTHERKCGMWHVELHPFSSVRPRLAVTAEKGRSFLRVQGLGDDVFELAEGHCQKSTTHASGTSASIQ